MRFIAAIGVLVLMLLPERVDAACAGTSDARELVGYVPDIVFTSGVPESRTISHRHVLRRAYPLTPGGYLPYSECGAIARSSTPGLSIRSTYFDIGVVHGPGEWAGLGGSHLTQGAPSVLPPLGLELIFDGQAPPGTIGTVEIAQNIGGDGVGYIPRLMGIANVYVVAPGAPPPRTWATVTAARRSITGSKLILDHPLLNGAPDHFIFVTHARSGGVNAWPHPVSVSYDTALARWTIANDDAALMPAGIAFHVRIDPSAMRVSRPRRSPVLTSARLQIDDPRVNYNPFATIFVTPASPNPHPVAVRYDAPNWYIVNEDGAGIGRSQKFHVQIFGATAYRDDRYRSRRPFNPLGTNDLSGGVGIDMHGTGSTRTAGANRYLVFSWTTGTARPLILTANQTPIARDRVIDANYSGVWFTGATAPANRSAIAHANGVAMPNNSSFNVWAPPP
jgi:hypothetical protein